MVRAHAGSVGRREPILSAISEEGSSRETRPVPSAGTNVFNRYAFHQIFPGSRFSTDSAPPSYSSEDAQKSEIEISALRNNKHIAKRGGWRRLLIIGIIAILCVVALAVGLGVGLSRKHNSENSNGESAGSTSPDASNNTTFPAGAYSIQTFLSSTSANCSSNPSTWLCYPDTTYSESGNASTAIWDWIISPIAHSSNYTVSSTANVFSILFDSAVMTLQDAGSKNEHYYFEIKVPKSVKPNIPLGSANKQATCFFNETVLQGSLFTQNPMTDPNGSGTNATLNGRLYTPWPHMVMIEQVSPSGSGTPTCVDADGNSLGDFEANNGGNCECSYKSSMS